MSVHFNWIKPKKENKNNNSEQVGKLKCYFIYNYPPSAIRVLRKLGGELDNEGEKRIIFGERPISHGQLYGINDENRIVAFNDWVFSDLPNDIVYVDQDKIRSQDGNILVSIKVPGLIVKSNGKFQIRKGNRTIYLGCYFAILNNTLIENPKMYDYQDFVSAKGMKNAVREILHNNGKDWNDETKELRPWTWKPKQGEKYKYFMNGSYHISTNSTQIDHKRIKRGNCFKC